MITSDTDNISRTSVEPARIGNVQHNTYLQSVKVSVELVAALHRTLYMISTDISLRRHVRVWYWNNMWLTVTRCMIWIECNPEAEGKVLHIDWRYCDQIHDTRDVTNPGYCRWKSRVHMCKWSNQNLKCDWPWGRDSRDEGTCWAVIAAENFKAQKWICRW